MLSAFRISQKPHPIIVYKLEVPSHRCSPFKSWSKKAKNGRTNIKQLFLFGILVDLVYSSATKHVHFIHGTAIMGIRNMAFPILALIGP